MTVQLSESMNGRYAQLQSHSSYQSLKILTESQVDHWRWATWPRFRLRPFDSERNRFPKGRWLNSEPSVKRDSWLHAFDDSGRVILIRGMSELPGVFSEEFFVHAESQVECAWYDSYSSEPLTLLTRIQLVDGAPIRYEARSPQSVAVADYVHADGRLVFEHLISESSPPGDRYFVQKFQYHYDSAGRLNLIECLEQNLATGEPAQKYVRYRRPQKGQSKKELSERLASLTAQSIPETLRAAGIREKVFNLLIVYDNENFPLPPMLALGSEALRQRAKQEHGKNAKYEIWNPADYQYFNTPNLELKDPELLEACALLNQQMAESDNFQPGRQLLNSVAAQLQQRDWTGILPTTDDFVVVAVDLESQDDLRKNISKSVPPELIKQLKREGLL